MNCSATNRQGKPCGRTPAPGFTVCNLHGAKAPQVKAKAKQRLLEAVDPLVARLVEIGLDSSEPVEFDCVECGETNVQKVGFDVRNSLIAIRDALDRAGISEPKTVEVVTLDAIDREIARLQAEMALQDDEMEEV